MTPRHAHRAAVRRSEAAARARQWRRRNEWWEDMTARFAEAAANPSTIILPPGDPMDGPRPVGETTRMGGIRYPAPAPFVPCSRGVCAAEEGHNGTCPEASGWDEEPIVTPIPESVRRARADTLIRRILDGRKARA